MTTTRSSSCRRRLVATGEDKLVRGARLGWALCCNAWWREVRSIELRTVYVRVYFKAPPGAPSPRHLDWRRGHASHAACTTKSVQNRAEVRLEPLEGWLKWVEGFQYGCVLHCDFGVHADTLFADQPSEFLSGAHVATQMEMGRSWPQKRRLRHTQAKSNLRKGSLVAWCFLLNFAACVSLLYVQTSALCRCRWQPGLRWIVWALLRNTAV
jgi:hypothetical protein